MPGFLLMLKKDSIRKLLKRSDYKTLSIYLFIVGLIILIVQGLHIYAGKEIIREVNNNQLMIIKEISSDIQYIMAELEEKLLTLAKLYPINQLEDRAVLFDLRIYYELMHDKVSHIGIMNQHGQYKYLYPTIPEWQEISKREFSNTDFFRNALAQAKNNGQHLPYISSQYDQGIGFLSIPISLPLYSNKNNHSRMTKGEDLLGVLIFFLDLAVINDICQNHYSHLHDYSSFWLIDHQGKVLSYENKSWLNKDVLKMYQGQSLDMNLPGLDFLIRERVLKQASGTDVYWESSVDNSDKKGIGSREKYYLNYTPVKLSGTTWAIGVSTPSVRMSHWERRVLKSAWQWLLFVISFILVVLSFLEVVIILRHKKRINLEKERREKFQTAFDGITDLVYMIDNDYNLQMVNKAFMTLCGHIEKEIEGQKCFKFIRGHDNPCPDCPILKTQSVPGTQRLEQIIFQETANLYAYPLINEEGKSVAMVIFARIITKEKMLEQELQHKERLSLLGKLTASVAHEIKNPLVGITMLAQLIRDSLAPDHHCLDDLDRIISEGKRLEQMINNFSKFSRPAPLSFNKADIHKSLDLSLALLREKLKKNDIQLILDYQTDIPPITHDVQKMQQVFLNLIINAINAMPNGGKLEIKTRLRPPDNDHCILQPEGEAVCIDIHDTGIGILPQDLEKIFEPFFSNSLNGTGLGLAIGKSIIQEHGGQIHVVSQPAQGTTFTVCLPVEPGNGNLL